MEFTFRHILFVVQNFLQTLQGKYNELKEVMDMLTKSSVDNLLKRLLILASRPLVEFNKYEGLELVDALKKAAHDSKHEKKAYYRLSPVISFATSSSHCLGTKTTRRS